ncbi:hypothetical protein HDU97_008055 [Phlyctochytrium planicorne]|nr:hypothetical protein HDU97_008055 [Phlyctochytrium planicorne]
MASENIPIPPDMTIEHSPAITSAIPSTLLQPKSKSKCKFFKTPGGCRGGEQCKFLHTSDTNTPPPKQPEPSNLEPEPVSTPPDEASEGDVEDACQPGKPAKKSRRRRSKKSLKDHGAKSDDGLSKSPKKPALGPIVPIVKRVMTLKMVDGKLMAVEVDVDVQQQSQQQSPMPADRNPNALAKKKKGRKGKRSSGDERPEPAPDNEGTTTSDNATSKPKSPPGERKQVQPPSSRPPVARPQAVKPATPLMPTERLQSEIQALERRFRTTPSNKVNFKEISRIPNSTTFRFSLFPSDPDFPFELSDGLLLDLTVLTSEDLPPNQPPISGSMIKVRTPSVPGHLARGIERAWDRTTSAICSTAPTGPGSTLLALTNWLDRNLEKLLSVQDTIGVVSFVKNESEDKEVGERRVQAGNALSGDEGELVPREEIQGEGSGFKSMVFYYGVPRQQGDDTSSSDDEDDFYDDDDDEVKVSNAASDFGDEDDDFEPHNDSHDDDDDEDDHCDENDEDHDESKIGSPPPPSFLLSTSHRGIQIRLPDLSLNSISLMSCSSLCLQGVCLRCKSDVPLPPLAPTVTRHIFCPQCSAPISIGFRPTPLHAQSKDLGYVDAEGVRILDLLPSAWEAVCGECGKTNMPGGMLKSLPRGVEAIATCGFCFKQMKATLNLVKFVQLMGSAIQVPDAATLMPKKKRKNKDEDGVIVVGQPLPKNGACAHYKKSYRWFRFPCCGKVYPCDICHDLATQKDHDMQWANRMICGFCCREQLYSSKPCVCGKELTRKSIVKGFWEGGLGTRDPALMSRKENRKHKNKNKTVSMKSARVGPKR